MGRPYLGSITEAQSWTISVIICVIGCCANWGRVNCLPHALPSYLHIKKIFFHLIQLFEQNLPPPPALSFSLRSSGAIASEVIPSLWLDSRTMSFSSCWHLFQIIGYWVSLNFSIWIGLRIFLAALCCSGAAKVWLELPITFHLLLASGFVSSQSPLILIAHHFQ